MYKIMAFGVLSLLTFNGAQGESSEERGTFQAVDAVASSLGDIMLATSDSGGTRRLAAGMKVAGAFSDFYANTFSRDSFAEKQEDGPYTLLKMLALGMRGFSYLKLAGDEKEKFSDTTGTAVLLRLLSLGASWIALNQESKSKKEGADEAEIKCGKKRWGLSRLSAIWLRALADMMSSGGSYVCNVLTTAAAGIDSYEALYAVDTKWKDYLQEKISKEAKPAVVKPVVVVSCEKDKDAYEDKACLICARDDVPASSMVACSACHQELCQKCFDRSVSFKEERDTDRPATTHPACLHYREDLSNDEYEQVLCYATATPESKPEWAWYHINGHDYFLEGRSLWRYASEDELDVSSHWRFIRPRCPYCNKVMKSALRPYLTQ